MRAWVLVGLAACLLLAGCSGIRVAQDYDPVSDFTALTTFTWASGEQAPTGDPRIDSPLRDARIREAVEMRLTAKGYRKAAAGPRFQIRYQYLLQRALHAYGPTIGFGLGTGRHGRYGGFGIGSGGTVDEYDEGTLIIDFNDPATGELLWRGTGTHIYQEYRDPQKTTREIDQLVDKILGQFPPTP